MKRIAKGLFQFPTILISFLAGPLLAHTGNGGDIRIDQIQPAIVNTKLAVSARFHNLFSPRIVGTIQSGLPSVVKIDIKLLDARKKNVWHKKVVHSISYNIWEERYFIRDSDSTQTYTSLDTLKRCASRLNRELLLPVARLSRFTSYFIKMRVEIVPISVSQGEKVADWLSNPNQTEESLASQERSSGFKVNLSKLVSFFVERKKPSQFSSSWFPSKFFKIEDLK